VPVQHRWLARAAATAAIAVLGGVMPGIAPAASAASKPFEFAGVIEGSYGPTWSHTDRMGAIRWMATHGLDTYVHAPKFDAYQRAQWRDPYPAGAMADFAEEVRLARRLGVAWVPNVSPGTPLIPGPPGGASVSRDICFACPDDVAVLIAKLEPFFRAGARTLMVSFDDVQKVSTHPEDAARYGTDATAYGHMTRDVLNAVQHHFQARAGREHFRLFTVLADYSGTADTAYLKAVRSGAGLDPAIVVTWTGITVVAPTIRAADAAAYARLVGRRRVGIWDNYPTNDYTGNAAGRPSRVFLGPYRGRDRRLPSAVSGIVANVMNEALANRFALGTVGRYVADPRHYDPEVAWRATIADLGGTRELTDALAALAENSRSSALDRRESMPLTARVDAFLARLSTPFWRSAYAALVDELQRQALAATTIRAGAPELAAQLAPFLDRLTAEAGSARSMAAALAGQRPALDVRVSRLGGSSLRVTGRAAAPSPADVASAMTAAVAGHAVDVADSHVVHGDRVTPSLSDPQTVGTLYVNDNRIDALFADVMSRTVAWTAQAPAAASGVTVTLDGHTVTLRGDGSFSVLVPARSGTHELVAKDGAGGRTGVRVTT
jgi:hyaluronoglucosaminidase